ncbi:MAG TPA: beta-ketoacyl reductase, partial [Herpetosiphonaceae bacterium]|nr:beta-ketoacyl reductase [Herpetosiphonaceae bacterium]
HLVLMSRRGVPRSGTAADTALAALAAMHQAGAEVQIATADVAEEAQVARVLSDIDRSLPPLRGIIHAAGVLDDGILLQLNRERFRTTMAPKLDGAWNLHTLTLDKPLDFFVLFSSAASMLGSPGQGNYAAANAFLDGLAHHRRALGRPALSINWGPWADVGLAAQVSQNGQATIGGIAAIPPQQGVEVLGQLLRQEAAQVGVMPLNLRQWRQFYPKAAKSPLLAHLQEQESAAGARKSGHDMRAALLAVEPGERRALLEAHLREEITQVLRIAPSRLDEQTALGSLGLDSLMALELRNRLEDSLELTLPVTLIWNYQTIADLTPHLAEKMGIALDTTNDEQPEAGATSQFSDEEREELARVLREFGELSADDLEAVAAL